MHNVKREQEGREGKTERHEKRNRSKKILLLYFADYYNILVLFSFCLSLEVNKLSEPC